MEPAVAEPTTAESAYRNQWARIQAADALALHRDRIARAERVLADTRRLLVIAEMELAAAQEARD
jgi:hypothetical protein